MIWSDLAVVSFPYRQPLGSGLSARNLGSMGALRAPRKLRLPRSSKETVATRLTAFASTPLLETRGPDQQFQ